MTHRPDTMTHGSAHKAYVDAISKIAGDTRESLGALIRHGGEKGALAETIASDFLKKVLPKRYSIGSGFIVTGIARICKNGIRHLLCRNFIFNNKCK